MDTRNLTEHDPAGRDDPLGLFAAWLEDASRSEINDPNAVALATVDASGMPDVRMVLLKGFDRRGFTFYTNFESAKGTEILQSMKAAMCFHWKSVRRQVRVRGPVGTVSDAEADGYFASRARGSRIGARVSRQSRPLASRTELETAVQAETAPFGSRAPPTGRASGSSRKRSSSGRKAISACTTASCFPATARAGTYSACIPDA